MWPKNEQIKENILNNNSIVAKIIYKNFSILLTGDIEKIAEKQILYEYQNRKEMLKSNCLKIAHHGSQSSSTEEFLNAVTPKISLIGVGEQNKFGHPNIEVIERLKLIGTKIYRTDKDGEITIIIDRKGRIKIKKYCD